MEQSDLGLHYLSMRLQIFQWTDKNIHLLIMRSKGYICEFSVYMVLHELHARLRGLNNLLILHQVINKT